MQSKILSERKAKSNRSIRSSGYLIHEVDFIWMLAERIFRRVYTSSHFTFHYFFFIRSPSFLTMVSTHMETHSARTPILININASNI